MNKNKEIGNRIKERRKELNLTQEQVGNIIGVAKSTIQRYENGLIADLKMPVIQAIATALKINPNWLILKSDIKEDYIDTQIQLLNSNYNKLSNIGKEKLIDYSNDLLASENYTNNEYITEVAARGDSEKKVKIKKSYIEKDLENYTPPDKL